MMAVLHAEGDTISKEDLELNIHESASAIGLSLKDDKEERDRIRRALKQTGGNKKLAAQLLGIGRTTLYNNIGEYGIKEKEE